jgi:acyl-coenzyme A thioesterase PaaI-like protein
MEEVAWITDVGNHRQRQSRTMHGGHGSLDGGVIASVGDESLHAAIRCSRDFRGGGLERGPIARNHGDIHTLLC